MFSQYSFHIPSFTHLSLMSGAFLPPLPTSHKISNRSQAGQISMFVSVFRFCQNSIGSLLKRSTNIRTDTKWDQLLIIGIRTCVKERQGRRGENVEPS